MDDVLEQNRVLRARVAQLEQALSSGVDPLQRTLANHAAEFLNVVTPEGRFLATGRPSEAFGSVVGHSVMEFVEPQFVGRMREVFARVVATGTAAIADSAPGEDHGRASRLIQTGI